MNKRKRSNIPSSQTSPVLLLFLRWWGLALRRSVHHLLWRWWAVVGTLGRAIAILKKKKSVSLLLRIISLFQQHLLKGIPQITSAARSRVKRTFAGGTEERLGLDSILGWTLLRRASGDENGIVSQTLKARSCRVCLWMCVERSYQVGATKGTIPRFPRRLIVCLREQQRFDRYEGRAEEKKS